MYYKIITFYLKNVLISCVFLSLPTKNITRHIYRQSFSFILRPFFQPKLLLISYYLPRATQGQMPTPNTTSTQLESIFFPIRFVYLRRLHHLHPIFGIFFLV